MFYDSQIMFVFRPERNLWLDIVSAYVSPKFHGLTSKKMSTRKV
jgi:hypothetical protein